MSILRSAVSLILLMILTSASLIEEPINSLNLNDSLLRETDFIDYRLSSNVKPNHYVINLMPKIGPDDFTFDGLTIIKISVLNDDTKTFILHAKDLNFDEKFTTLIRADGTKVWPWIQMLDVQREFLNINFNTPLAAGDYVLNLKFNGQLNDEPYGFYKTSYIDDSKKKTWLAATQFAPIYARRAFPCFDEPSFKSKFEISIKHFKDWTATSNMPISRTIPDENDDKSYWTHFQVTPIMSTYQVAFVISKLEQITDENEKFRVWTQNNQTDKIVYPERLIKTNLQILEDYMNFDIVTPKINFFAIPEVTDSVTNSWGLVAYGESSIFFNENITKTSEKQEIALTLANGLVRQWFGGLASPEWWDLSWLDSGLAKYFSYFINDQVEMTWQLMDQFVIKILQEKAFFIDDEEDQHSLWPIEINTPADIKNIFDNSSVNKVACIIRMISHTIGTKVFRIGLKAYVRNSAYGAASLNDFIGALDNARGRRPYIHFQFLVLSWIKNKGYPVVSVEKWAGNKYVRLSQSPYVSETNVIQSNQIWYIPISYGKSAEHFISTEPDLMLIDKYASPSIDLNPDEWLVINNKQTGYYRVMYDINTWRRIIECMENNQCYLAIPEANRAQLLDDSFALAQFLYYDTYYQFLELSTYLRHEDNYIPWYAAFRAFSTFDKALANTENYNLFKLYILRIIETLEKNVGYDELQSDDHLTKLNRIHLVSWACKMGSVNCNSFAHEKLLGHVFETEKISTDLRKGVLCAGIRTANSSIWEKTFIYYQQSKDRTERQIILESLGCSSDRKILKSYLTTALKPESKVSLGIAIASMVKENECGVDVALDFLKENFQAILNSVDGEKSVLRYANDVASRVSLEYQNEKMEKIVNSLLGDRKDLANALTKSALATIMKNLKWLRKHESTISEFLVNQKLMDENSNTTDINDTNASAINYNYTIYILVTFLCILLNNR